MAIGGSAAVLTLSIALMGFGQNVITGDAPDGALQNQVRELMDKQQIHDMMMRYSRGVDRADASLVSTVYWPDAIDDRGNGNIIRGSATGKALAAGRKATEKRHQLGQHFVGNELIEVEGDSAYAEFYFMSNTPTERDGQEYTRYRAGRYLDRWERRNGQWKIAYRVVVDDWDRLDKLVEAAPGSSNWRRSALGDEDPSATMRTGATHEAEKAIREKLETGR